MFVVKQKINGRDYYYLRKSVREADKIKSKYVAYLGKDKDESEKKAKDIIEKIERGENLSSNFQTLSENNFVDMEEKKLTIEEDSPSSFTSSNISSISPRFTKLVP